MKRLFLLYLLFLLLSCGKGVFGPARVDGIEKDATTDEPIYNATVYLFERENPFEFLGTPSPEILIVSTTTGAQGRFDFTYDDRHGYAYSVFPKKYNYIEWANPESILSLGSGTDIEILLHPKAFLNIHFINIEPALSSDSFGINGSITETFYGSDIDTILTYSVVGNSYSVIHWVVGYENTISDTIYCPAFDTTYYEILY